MPNARIKYGKVGDMWKRKWALLAWKLGRNRLVVDEGVALSSVVGGSLGVYRELKGGKKQ